jgi:AraC-like DNA-binding protein
MTHSGQIHSQARQNRSQARRQFDAIPRPIAILAKDFSTHTSTGLHHHGRAQLLHASTGLMRLITDAGQWVVPQGHAVWIPARLEHQVDMHGGVAMRTLYVARDAAADLPSTCRVIEVSSLLRATILALAQEQVRYDEAGRGGHLAALILDEIRRSVEAPLALPMPGDPRLGALAKALIADPALDRDLDDWAREIAMSRRNLTRLFRAQTGLSVIEWRRRLRTMTAATLVAEGMPVAGAAGAVGYRTARSLQSFGQ